MNCPACHTEVAESAKFCGVCGTALSARCAVCGATHAPGQRFCEECGAALTVPSPPPTPAVVDRPAAATAGELRLVSVLFVDLVGFTALSEAREAEDVRELLGRYFDSARTIVERYGGVVEKFIGDAVMAVWGVPAAREDDAERAVRAALDVTDAVSRVRRAGWRPRPAREGRRRDRPGGGASTTRARGWSSETASTPPRASSRWRGPARCWSTR